MFDMLQVCLFIMNAFTFQLHLVHIPCKGLCTLSSHMDFVKMVTLCSYIDLEILNATVMKFQIDLYSQNGSILHL